MAKVGSKIMTSEMLASQRKAKFDSVGAVKVIDGVLQDGEGNVISTGGSGGTGGSNGSGGSGGALVYDTLTALQNAFPTGNTQPAWIRSENAWYYWDGVLADTTPPVLTITSGGNFTGTKTVTMGVNETSSTIYYTLDGSTPTTSSSVYSNPLSITATTILKAFAKDSAGNSSVVQTVTYTLGATDTTAPTVTASPSGGTYTNTQNVTLTANETATIYYTLDGSTPTTSSAVYSSPITISSTQTLKFFAKDTAGNSSTPVSVTYTISVPTPDTTPPSEVSNITVTNITKTSVQLNWTVSASSDTAFYDIYNNGTLVTSVGHPNGLSVISGLTLGTTYANFVIKARDNVGNVSTGVNVPSFSTLNATGYLINLDGVSGKVVIPNPAGTRIITMTLARRNNDTGIMLDMRPNNNVYSGNSSLGYTSWIVNNGTNQGLSNANVANLPNDTKVDLKITLSADAVAGNISIGKHNSANDYLNMDLYDVKLYDVNNNLLNSFTFSGSGTTLTGTNGNGTITNGTWIAY